MHYHVLFMSSSWFQRSLIFKIALSQFSQNELFEPSQQRVNIIQQKVIQKSVESRRSQQKVSRKSVESRRSQQKALEVNRKPVKGSRQSVDKSNAVYMYSHVQLCTLNYYYDCHLHLLHHHHHHHSRLIRKGVNQFTCYLKRCDRITPYLKRCEHIHTLSKKV